MLFCKSTVVVNYIFNCNIYCKSKKLRSWDYFWLCQCVSVTSSSNSSSLTWAIILPR